MSEYLDKLKCLVDAGENGAAIKYAQQLMGTPMQLYVIRENNCIELYQVTALLEQFNSAIDKNIDMILEAERICRELWRARCVVEPGVINAISVLAPRIVYLRGEAYEDHATMRKAIDAAAIVAKKMPSSAAALYSYGWLLFRNKQYDVAYEALVKAGNLVVVESDPLLAGRIQLCQAMVAFESMHYAMAVVYCMNAEEWLGKVEPRGRAAADLEAARGLLDKLAEFGIVGE